MLDPNFIFNNKELVKEKLFNKKYILDYDKFSKLYLLRKKAIQNLEELKGKLNQFNKKITQEKRKPSSVELEEIKGFSNQSKEAEKNKKKVEVDLNQMLLEIPNLHDDSVPKGENELSNIEVRKINKKI
jgi:seryl-tRNA synthetase